MSTSRPTPGTIVQLRNRPVRDLSGSRVASRNLQQEAVGSVHEFRSTEKHEWTMSIHHPDPIVLTKRGRLRAHCSLTASAVDPHIPYARSNAIRNNLASRRKWRHHEHALDRFFHRLQGMKTFSAIDFVCGPIDRNDLITAVAHFPEEQTAEVLGIPRDPDDRDSAQSKEIFDVTNCAHGKLLGRQFITNP
jgi:hypothetical protein